MPITSKTLFTKKHTPENVAVEILVEDENNKIQVYSGTYKHGELSTLPPGLKDANHMWDESKLRPKGFILLCTFESSNNWRKFIMVTEAFYSKNKTNMVELKKGWSNGWGEIR